VGDKGKKDPVHNLGDVSSLAKNQKSRKEARAVAMHGQAAQPCAMGRNGNEVGRRDRLREIIKYSSRDNRNTTLVKHLGNLLVSIREFNHHLIETKRPRTPLKLPNL